MAEKTALWDKLGKRVLDNCMPEPNSGCWIWTGYLHKNGYATVKFDNSKRTMMAHRVSYLSFKGEIPGGLVLDHKCKNRSCVNPDHLEPVTYAVNNSRSPKTIRLATHCKHGHPFSGGNLQIGRQRRCRECNRRVGLASYYKKVSQHV